MKHFHWLRCDYDIWIDTVIVTTMVHTGKEYKTLGQKRVCKICNKKQTRTT